MNSFNHCNPQPIFAFICWNKTPSTHSSSSELTPVSDIIHGPSMFHWWHHHFCWLQKECLLLERPCSWETTYSHHQNHHFGKWNSHVFIHFLWNMHPRYGITVVTITRKLPWKHHCWWFHPKYCCYWTAHPHLVVSWNRGTPGCHPFLGGMFPSQPTILGCLHLWKPPCDPQDSPVFH